MRIVRSQCCGNAQCSEFLPQVFTIDSRNKAVASDPEGVPEELLIEAAESCPCQAIEIEDDEGNVFP